MFKIDDDRTFFTIWLQCRPLAKATGQVIGQVQRKSNALKTTDPDDSPEMVHRVAMYVGAMIEAQKWINRGIELKRQGKLKAAEAVRPN